MTDHQNSSAGSEGVPTCAHISYCSANNAPALPKGPCDCGASEVAAIAGLVYPDWIHLDDKEPADQDIIGDVTSTARRIYEAGYRKQGDAWDALERHGFPPEACDNLPQAIDNAITCLIETRESLLAEMKVFRAPAQPTREWIAKRCPFCGSPKGQYAASTDALSAAFICKGCGINEVASQPSPAATVETHADSDGSLSEGNANVGDRIGRTRRPAHPMDTISGGPIGPSDTQCSAGTGDVRWAVNYLLEQIATKFEAWETLDLFRSDAAATVRSFKHDLALSDDLPTDIEDELWHKATSRLQEIADDDTRGRYGRLAREVLEHLATLQFLGPASSDRLRAVPQTSGVWQSIETAPKDGTNVILGDESDPPMFVVAFWQGGSWLVEWDHEYFTDATRWMPIPSSPLSRPVLLRDQEAGK